MRTGHSLLELLIALTLAVAVGVVTVAAFAAGLRTWERARALQQDAGWRIALETFERDVRNALPFRGAPFAGRRDSIEFAGRVPAERSGRLGVIRYAHDRGARALVRERRVWRPEATAQGPEEILVSDVGRVAFAYGDGSGRGEGVWEDAWLERTNLPAAVRVRLEVGEGEGRREVQRIVVRPGP
jgi:type II secretory pathway component PulJ